MLRVAIQRGPVIAYRNEPTDEPGTIHTDSMYRASLPPFRCVWLLWLREQLQYSLCSTHEI